MADPAPHGSHDQHPDHAGPNFQTYMAVFYALCVLTACSFAANFFLGQNVTSMWIILAVSCAKATLVAMIFMHLKFDWSRLYFIVIPVVIMGVMMMLVLLPDFVLGWKFYPFRN